MKISTLISELQNILNSLGDLDVCADIPPSCDSLGNLLELDIYTITRVLFDTESSPSCVVVS